MQLRTPGRGEGVESPHPRRLLVARVLGVAAVLFALGLGSAAAAAPTRSLDLAVVVSEHVSAPGLYSVSVVVAGPSTATNSVALQIGDLARSARLDRRHPRAQITVRLRVFGRSLTVRAVGASARPRLDVSMHRVVTPAPEAPAAAASTPAPAPAAATPAPAPPPPPPPPPAQPPGSNSPYTNQVFSDDLTQAWASEGGTGAATEAVPSTFGFDNFGGCGGNSAKESTYPGSSHDAYLTSQGLVIPVNATGSTSYTSAQVDSLGHESWQYGTIEASITLPTGAGLCPAFWLYADNGSGEIDVLEAPSFVSPTYGPVNGPYAADSIFTLHANDSQQFEVATTPPGWNPSGPNVFGVIWTPTSITWTVNYVAYASATQSSLSNPSLWSAFTAGKFHIIFDDGVGGWPGDPAPGTVFTQPMTVQWVKVFQ